MQTWRFLYTKEKNIKAAITKTGAPIPGKTSFIITDGIDYTECLRKAMREGNFKESKLLGSYPNHLLNIKS